jgi:hypothetical protein
MPAMKIAYLMLVHRNPRLLKRVIRALSSEGCAFFIHIDRKSDIREFAGIGGRNVFLSEPRRPVYWAEFSNVEAEMQLIRQALDSSEEYDYLVFMQGSDYPLRSGKYIQKFLEKNRGCEFMSLARMPAPGFPISKINTIRYTSDKPIRRFAFKMMARLGLAQRDWRKYLGELEPFAGDACWALSRDACRHILEFNSTNPHVSNYFRNTHVPEESFFHTILGNSPFLPRMRRSLLYRDWPRTNMHHPESLTEAHIRLFEEQEKVWGEDQFGSGEMLFARKFSDASLHLVDRLDAMMIRKDEHGKDT